MAKKDDAAAAADKDTGARSFIHFLRSIDQGCFEQELSEELHEMGKRLAEVTDTGVDAKGELVIKLSFKAQSDRAGTVTVIHDVKAKHPKLKRSAGGTFWIGKGANFETKHPTQQELPLRVVVDAPSARDIDDANPAPVRSI